MRAAAFMTTDVLTLRPETPLKVAAAALVQRNVASAPVVDGGGRLVGIVSELDLLARDVPPDPLARIGSVAPDTAPLPTMVQDVMTREVITLPPAADAALFLEHMLRDRVVCIPVAEDGRLLGVVSRRDLLRLFARPDHEIAADVEAALSAALPGQPWRAAVRDGLVHIAGGGAGRWDAVHRVAQSVPGVVRVLPPDATGPDRPEGDAR